MCFDAQSEMLFLAITTFLLLCFFYVIVDNSECDWLIELRRVVRKPVNANQELKVNKSINFLQEKMR